MTNTFFAITNQTLTYFTIFESAIYAMFLALLLVQLRKKAKEQRFFELFSGVVFGLLLEIANMHIGNTYSYGNGFIVYFFGAPLAIGVAWSVLFHTARLVSDALGKKHAAPWYARAAFESIFVLSADIILDVLAVRLGLWQWVIPLNTEWFGVPYENFTGWILVVISFSLTVRAIRMLEKNEAFNHLLNQRRWHSKIPAKMPAKLATGLLKTASPVIAYILFLVLFIPQTAIVNASASATRQISPHQIKGIIFLLALITITRLSARLLSAELLSACPANKKKSIRFYGEISIKKIKTGLSKDTELLVSAAIILAVHVVLLSALSATKMHKEAPALVLLQSGILLLNALAFAAASSAASDTAKRFKRADKKS